MRMSDITPLHKTTRDDGQEVWDGVYGPELMLDCCSCDTSTFTRESIRGFMKGLCKTIDMKAQELIFQKCHSKDITAVQFILTSNINVHTVKTLERVYVNIFSCKTFNEGDATRFTQEWFKAKSVGTHLISRC